MGDSFALDRLCYPGKAVEIRVSGITLSTVASSVTDATLGVADACDEGACEVRLTFLSEPYVATGAIRSFDRGCEVVIDGGFTPLNDRSAPRVMVNLNGTYYLRPPMVGVPMEIVDLSVSGLALLPMHDLAPRLFERRMISFSLEGRKIRTVIELVGVEPQLLRGRFLRLSVSDEEAIAGYVMARQVAERQGLSMLEVRTPSALDVAARRRYPLVEGVVVHEHALELSARGNQIEMQLPPSTAVNRQMLASALGSMVGEIRCGDLNDNFHYLSRIGSGDEPVDFAALGCLLLHSRLYECSPSELLRKALGTAFGGAVIPELKRGTDVLGYAAGESEFRDDSGHGWRLFRRSLGVGLYFQISEDHSPDGDWGKRATGDPSLAQAELKSARLGQWITPMTMVKLMESSEHPLLLGYWYQDLGISRQLEEILYELATSAEPR